MKITINTDTKTVTVEGKVDHYKLMEILKKGLPSSWDSKVKIKEFDTNELK